MKEFLVLVLVLALSGDAATMYHAAVYPPTSAVAADYSGVTW